MDYSKIEWTDRTWNGHRICTPVSPACANCYAAALAKRTGAGEYKSGVPRLRTSDTNWRKPLQWQKAAYRFSECLNCHWRGDPCHPGEGLPKAAQVPRDQFNTLDISCPKCGAGGSLYQVRQRVFSDSLSDWLDDEAPIEWLADRLNLIANTPDLDWLLLTKRPELWLQQIMGARDFMMAHIYRGADCDTASMMLNWENGPFSAFREHVMSLSVEQAQEYAKSHSEGLALACGWLRSEVEDSDDIPPPNVWFGFTGENQHWFDHRWKVVKDIPARVHFCSYEPACGPLVLPPDFLEMGSHAWLIAGGESGAGRDSRPIQPEWARSLRKQCAAAGVPFLFKQWGHWHPDPDSPDPQPLVWSPKDVAGRNLDGVTWDESPIPRAEAPA
jgi:protein gp37